MKLSLILLCALIATSLAYNTYTSQDPVTVYTNRLGPYDNPSVNYPYYSLPFCGHDDAEEKEQHLGFVANIKNIINMYMIFFFFKTKPTWSNLVLNTKK